MLRALGMLELKSIAKGFSAADTMVKTAEVELVIAKPICPGKFIVLIQGGIAAVTASLERGGASMGTFSWIVSCWEILMTMCFPH
ncbi:MAG: BMC domain-containing protein [Clostridia bacterium]